MRNQRIYANTVLSKNSIIELTPEASHHLIRVLRYKIGDSIVIFNGKGKEFNGILLNDNKKRCHIKLENEVNNNVESPIKIHLAQALTASDKMDFILQKAVELGVSEVTPLITSYCKVNLTKERLQKRHDHWQKIIINACEQCGRNVLPKLNMTTSFNQCISQVQADLQLILHPRNAKRLKDIQKKNLQNILIFIGPEGGFSDQELDLAVAQEIIPIALGARILRVETASITALSLLQAKWGDLN